MNARVEISIEANDAAGIEQALKEVAGMTFNWAWTNGGSDNQISKHVDEIERRGEWMNEDSGHNYTAAIAVEI